MSNLIDGSKPAGERIKRNIMRVHALNIAEWARKYGFKWDTVLKVIHGRRSGDGAGEQARIKRLLIDQGCWQVEEPEAEAVNS